MYRDLYTSVVEAEESDEFEKWCERQFETPGLEASHRLTSGKHVNRDDWHAIIRLAALQHVRTPQSYFERITRWNRDMPRLLDATLQESLSLWEKGARLTGDQPPDSSEFRVVWHKGEETTVGIEVLLGRRLWLDQNKRLLNGVADKLLEHQWSVWQPHDGFEWPLTDDPSIRLNFYAPDKFDFEGGWGKRGSELMMPLSPHHLLYTQVGRPSQRRRVVSKAHTLQVIEVLCKRAHRWIVSTCPVAEVVKYRPRIVNREQFEREAIQWKRWHHDQRSAEEAYDSGT